MKLFWEEWCEITVVLLTSGTYIDAVEKRNDVDRKIGSRKLNVDI